MSAAPTEAAILHKTRAFVKAKLSGEATGHDWWHIVRVVDAAKVIAAAEHADLFVVELGALLHDIADWKFASGDLEAGPAVARELLEGLQADPSVIDAVVEIVAHISFKGGTNKHVMQTLEGKIVQDADRLDAIGAVGIARTFAFGGFAGREMYNPAVAPKQYADFKDVQASVKTNTTINHFYEKMLLLKDRMHTQTACQMAARRHEYTEQFLEEFYAEWDGRR